MVMSIVKTLLRNSTSKSRTLGPADLPDRPKAFKGLIEYDPGLCTGCHNCSYVCSPSAITFDESKEESLTWQFTAGQCTFCDLCVQFCPTGALSNQGVLPPVTADQSELSVAHEIAFEPCECCGELHIPVPKAAAERLFGPSNEDTEAMRVLCPTCRKKAAGQKIRDAMLGKEAAQ